MVFQSVATLLREVCAQTRSRGGATADLRSVSLAPLLDQWYFPRFPEHTRIVPLSDLAVSLDGFVAVRGLTRKVR